MHVHADFTTAGQLHAHTAPINDNGNFAMHGQSNCHVGPQSETFRPAGSSVSVRAHFRTTPPGLSLNATAGTHPVPAIESNNHESSPQHLHESVSGTTTNNRGNRSTGTSTSSTHRAPKSSPAAVNATQSAAPGPTAPTLAVEGAAATAPGVAASAAASAPRASGGSLPFTGSEDTPLIVFGVALVVTGGSAMTVHRRRHT